MTFQEFKNRPINWSLPVSKRTEAELFIDYAFMVLSELFGANELNALSDKDLADLVQLVTV